MRSLKLAEDPTIPDWLTSLPIAHRGLHDKDIGVIENSMSAFKRAIGERLPIELDVHLSSDHIPVVFHDETLVRMTGDTRTISDVSSGELEYTKLNGSTDCIPILSSVLGVVSGQVPLVIELKQSPFGRTVLAKKVWNVLKDYQGPFSIQSFDPIILSWFRTNAPSVIRGQLAMKSPSKKMPVYRKFLMRHMLLNRLSKPHYIGYNCDDIPYWPVKRATRKNTKLLVWTVSTEEQFNHARQFADNVIFENLPLDLVK